MPTDTRPAVELRRLIVAPLDLAAQRLYDRLHGRRWHNLRRYPHPTAPGVDVLKCTTCGGRGAAPRTVDSTDPRIRYGCGEGRMAGLAATNTVR